MPEPKHVAVEPSQAELDRPETTVNVVGPESWDSNNPRMVDPEQAA